MSISSLFSTISKGLYNLTKNNKIDENDDIIIQDDNIASFNLENKSNTDKVINYKIESKSYPILNIKDKKQIVASVNSGVSPSELSKSYKISSERVNRYVRKLNMGKCIYESCGRPKIIDNESDTFLKVNISIIKSKLRDNIITEAEHIKEVKKLIKIEYINSFRRRCNSLTTDEDDKKKNRKVKISLRSLRRYIKHYV